MPKTKTSTAKVKLAIIPPVAYLNDFSTDCHLVLAHLMKTCPPYFYYYLRRRHDGDFIIMDNGAAEQGAAIDSEELYKLACELRPNVLVCPDTLYKGDATIELTAMFLHNYAADLTAKGIALMGVPQGKTTSEWFGAFTLFNKDSRLTWLGISKYVKGAFARRYDALELIAKDVTKKCHLLGMADDIKIIAEEKTFSFVESTDTAVPVKLGMQSLSLDQYDLRTKIADKDYFFSSPTIDLNSYGQVLANIEAYKEYCL